MKLALIQMESAVGEIEANVRRADKFMDQACAQGAELVVLPEFWSTGYFPLAVDYGYYDLAATDDGCAMASTKAKAREHGVRHNYRVILLRDCSNPPGEIEMPDTLDASLPEGGLGQCDDVASVRTPDRLYDNVEGVRRGVWENRWRSVLVSSALATTMERRR